MRVIEQQQLPESMDATMFFHYRIPQVKLWIQFAQEKTASPTQSRAIYFDSLL